MPKRPRLKYYLEDAHGDYLIAGVDEAGRGPLAGDVVAAAVILDPALPLRGLNDSKQIPDPDQRTRLCDTIQRKAVAWAIGRASVAEIDRLNILHATMLAMRRAVDALAVRPELVYVDGNRCPEWDYHSQPVIGGDGRIKSIAAASILAKVSRDRHLVELDARYPGYGLAAHKGYATRQHLEALRTLGPCPEHRRSFAPVSAALAGESLALEPEAADEGGVDIGIG